MYGGILMLWEDLIWRNHGCVCVLLIVNMHSYAIRKTAMKFFPEDEWKVEWLLTEIWRLEEKGLQFNTEII